MRRRPACSPQALKSPSSAGRGLVQILPNVHVTLLESLPSQGKGTACSRVCAKLEGVPESLPGMPPSERTLGSPAVTFLTRTWQGSSAPHGQVRLLIRRHAHTPVLHAHFFKENIFLPKVNSRNIGSPSLLLTLEDALAPGKVRVPGGGRGEGR